MLQNAYVLKSICWLFTSTLFLSALQVTIAGYQSDENSLFSLITLTMAEEENEESEAENKDETKNTSNNLFKELPVVRILTGGRQQWSECTFQLYQSIMGEVVSPPPEFS